MIVRTDAVVLRAFDYGETSRIATLLTRQHGVVGLMAKGARRPSSRFGATLQPMAYVQAVYYYKPGRALHTLTETAHLHRFARLSADVGRITRGLRAVELARALLPEGEAFPQALELLVRTLTYLDAAEQRLDNGLLWFQLRLAALLGFEPDVQREDVLALGDDGGTLVPATGAVAPPETPGGVRASREALRAFAIFARTDLPTAARLILTDEQLAETAALVDAFVRFHTDDAFPERVRRVADEMDALARQTRR